MVSRQACGRMKYDEDLKSWVELQQRPTIEQNRGLMHHSLLGSIRELEETPSSHQLKLLKVSLQEYTARQNSIVQDDTALECGEHFLFWNDHTSEISFDTPIKPEIYLQKDGYHNAQAPPDHLWTHRLWTAGSMIFHHDVLLNVPATCSEQVTNIEAVDSVSCRITTQRQITQAGMVKLTEFRTLTYTNRDLQDRTSRLATPAALNSVITRFTPSRTLIMRYSALTSNSHRIHYDRDYALKQEGYRDVLIRCGITAIHYGL
ncbi:Putative uncharacterized protein [Taphrina deformans PYCC 5710]|uniref:N-terminal of MaoC-like dehydratase domain-containing protein n=1 Tax=Taphrina deformans (strain PYCC 5710 / ATCC 11124 / CBS 356.35 / IMI 108563 / JCM 9778 / NBRC 8474) TaxID=1097556 RepID=R4XCE4_TAPDE|nr:Putative uncharacterized protein [Taphrina deformans PYCC 5710]|eukprot:CCG82041.1 Putative uncharacterized protein [Taphrina deformans PYCC 5710]